MSRKLLSLHRQLPGVQAKEALDAVLVAGVFEQELALLFRDDGVWQLVESKLTEELAESIRSLPDYGIDAVYVCECSLSERKLTPEDLILSATVLSAAEQGELLSSQDMVLCD